MSLSRDNHKMNHKLPLINLKQIILLLIILLVNKVTSSPTTVTLSYECPKYCECDHQLKRVKCSSLDGLIASLNSEYKEHNSLHHVEALDLSNNNLTKVTHQLELLENLKELNLSNNDLSYVSKWNLKHLKTLDLSNNHITSGKISKIPANIVNLNLSNNDITYLPLSFMKLKKLKIINLDGNPINCTCDTLHVRNSLTTLHVWSDKHIKCTAPQSVKGKPWLQAKQNEICHQEIMAQQSGQQSGKYDWHDYEDDNELMQGDMPNEEIFDKHKDEMQNDDPDYGDYAGSGDGDDEEKLLNEDDEEAAIEDEFLPVVGSTSAKPLESKEEHEEKEENEDEGSGDDVPIAPLHIDVSSTTEEPSEEEEGSGTDGEPITISDSDGVSDEPPMVSPTTDDATEYIPPFTDSLDIYEDSVTPVVAVFKKPLGAAVTAEPDSEIFAATSGEILQENKSDVKTAESDDKGTLILLAILGIALLVLIVFVAMKNRKANSRNRREKSDVENAPATELMDMKKPTDKNGHGHTENAPLIGDRDKSDFAKPINGNGKPYNSQTLPAITVDEPAMKQNEAPARQNGNIEPVHQSPSNGSVPALSESDDVFHPALDHSPDSLAATPEVPKRYSPVYSPASPKSDRYSPVYEPETGRVKIKLTETPKPKTPVVVNRSRSKAGDYIITPEAPNQRTPNGN